MVRPAIRPLEALEREGAPEEGSVTLVGIAVGASSMIVPTSIVELAPTQIRGGLVIVQQLAISGGGFLSSVLDYVFFKLGWGRRPMFAAAVIPGAGRGTSWHEMLAPGVRGALIAGVGLAVLQQFVGPATLLSTVRRSSATSESQPAQTASSPRCSSAPCSSSSCCRRSCSST